MGYGDDLVTRMSFTDPMHVILGAAQAHRDALTQVFEKQEIPLVPTTSIGKGVAEVIGNKVKILGNEADLLTM